MAPASQDVGTEGTVQTDARAKRDAHIQAVAVLIIHRLQNGTLPVGDRNCQRRLLRAGEIGIAHILGNLRIFPPLLQELHRNFGGTDSCQISPGKLFPRHFRQSPVDQLFQYVFRMYPVFFIFHRDLRLPDRLVSPTDRKRDSVRFIVYAASVPCLIHLFRFLLFLIPGHDLTPRFKGADQRIYVVFKIFSVKTKADFTQGDCTSFHNRFR